MHMQQKHCVRRMLRDARWRIRLVSYDWHSDDCQSHATHVPVLGPLAVPSKQMPVFWHQPHLPEGAVVQP